jgi:hypothetical protein
MRPHLRIITCGLLGLVVWQSALAGCVAPTSQASQPASQPGARADIYCGMSSPDGSGVSEQEWSAFIDSVVAPALPSGFTVFSATGMWSEHEAARAISERTRMITCIGTDEPALHARIDAIADAYVKRFHQESVLVVWSSANYYLR